LEFLLKKVAVFRKNTATNTFAVAKTTEPSFVAIDNGLQTRTQLLVAFRRIG
jgi:hypothetical protein